MTPETPITVGHVGWSPDYKSTQNPLPRLKGLCPSNAADCSPSSTPETDRKVKRICGNWNNAGDRVQEFVLADFARKLERERDEARKTLRGETNLACERTRLLHDEMEKSWNLTQEVEGLIKQRDEARAMARDMRNQLEQDSRARLIFPWENAE